MKLRDYSLVAERLILPIGGKEYTLPDVSLEDGIQINLALAGEIQMSNIELRDRILGNLVEEFQRDGVPAEATGRAMMAGLALFRQGIDAAQVMWETGGDPKVIALYVETATQEKPSTSTGAGTTTKKPVSGTGTKTSPVK